MAVARAEAIHEELGLNYEFQLRDLPIEEPRERTQRYINSQPVDLKPPAHYYSEEPVAMNLKAPGLTVKEEKPCPAKELNP